ncbi:DUF3040 domain-containing protein [Corynebacterium amycolatum]|uniref:DUF3040 domain-containing protein n=1 Tax=Corynebacterium amycolatum TaxID=43765 RepID=UPI003D710D7E
MINFVVSALLVEGSRLASIAVGNAQVGDGGIVGLSEHEQRMLDEIESALYAEDPKFSSTMAGNAFSFPEENSAPRGFSIQVFALMLLGLLMLIGGVALFSVSNWFIVLSVAGFGLMFGSGVWALTGAGKQEKSSSASGLNFGKSKSGAAKSRRGASGGRGFSGDSTLESRFRGRFEGR